MRHCGYLLLLMLSVRPVYSQDAISVDAVLAMHACGPNDSSAATPCATPKPLSKVNPYYPERARKNRKEGTVTLGLTLDKDGSVSGVHVVTGADKDIDQAAMEAVSQWKFLPGTYQGNPVDVEIGVTVNFRLTAAMTPLTGNPQEQTPNVDERRNVYSDASEAYNRGDYATAANLLRKVTSIIPQHGPAWNRLGRALLAHERIG